MLHCVAGPPSRLSKGDGDGDNLLVYVCMYERTYIQYIQQYG